MLIPSNSLSDSANSILKKVSLNVEAPFSVRTKIDSPPKYASEDWSMYSRVDTTQKNNMVDNMMERAAVMSRLLLSTGFLSNDNITSPDIH